MAEAYRKMTLCPAGLRLMRAVYRLAPIVPHEFQSPEAFEEAKRVAGNKYKLAVAEYLGHRLACPVCHIKRAPERDPEFSERLRQKAREVHL